MSLLNQECPCNGTWTLGQKRVLDLCPPDQCISRAWLPSQYGVLGKPGFAVARLTDNGMRLAPFKLSESTGFNRSLGLDELPVAKTATCRDTISTNLDCGHFVMPCGSVTSSVTTGLDYSGVLELESSGDFKLVKRYFSTGFGCMTDVAGSDVFQFEANIQGSLEILADSDAIPRGHFVVASNLTATVTPRTREAVEYLTVRCPCSITASVWAVNEVFQLSDACLANTCKDTHFLGFQVGEADTAYGNLLRYFQQVNNESQGSPLIRNETGGIRLSSDFLRLTQFVNDKAEAAAKMFVTSDPVFLLKESCNAPAAGVNAAIIAGSVVGGLCGLCLVYYLFSRLLRRSGYSTIEASPSMSGRPPPTAPPPPPTAQPPPSDPCVICMDAPKNGLFAPCGHRCACISCCEQIQQGDGICPICRSPIASVVRVFDA